MSDSKALPRDSGRVNWVLCRLGEEGDVEGCEFGLFGEIPVSEGEINVTGKVEGEAESCLPFSTCAVAVIVRLWGVAR